MKTINFIRILKEHEVFRGSKVGDVIRCTKPMLSFIKLNPNYAVDSDVKTDTIGIVEDSVKVEKIVNRKNGGC